MTPRQSKRPIATRTNQSGFTLIELIMVIVILGILSAFALPKFADLSGSAEIASVEGVRAAIRSGAAIAHAQWLADGDGASTVTLEGATISMVNGYPAQDDLSDLVELGDYVQVDATTPGYVIITLSTSGGDPCIAYTESAAANAPPTISAVGAHTGSGAVTDTCS